MAGPGRVRFPGMTRLQTVTRPLATARPLAAARPLAVRRSVIVRRSFTVRRSVVLALAMCLPGLSAACSSGKSSTSTGPAAGVSVLGASYNVWVQDHPPIKVGNVSGYGNAVSIDGKSVPEFTAVGQIAGKVIGFHMTLPAGTHLGDAEKLVRAQLPTDIRQTASWRGTFFAHDAYCEFVNYQSATLAQSLGSTTPTGSTANIGTVLYERTTTNPGSASIAKVNSADVKASPYTVGQLC
jgi:hypothetical protein